MSGDDYDKPTQRWYCSECFSFTADEILSLEKKEGREKFDLATATPDDLLEEFFNHASDEEEQEVAESIYLGEFERDTDEDL